MSCNNDDAENVEISGTTTCGSDVNLNPVCSSSIACSCGCNPCTCASPAPFYNQAAACQEDHVRVCTNLTYTAVVTSGTAFNMPACGQSVTVKFPGLKKLQPGSFLWNTTYGYLQVTAFDCVNEQAVLYNDCQLANASPGTAIPACTSFNVVDPPYEDASNCGEGVFVINDFIVPVLGATVDVDVNTTAGLTLGQTVQVGVGSYTLNAILTPTSIRLYNYGGVGVVPGTTISAHDGFGNCITPVTPAADDPCDEVPVTQGAIVVCSGGKTSTLNAGALGQVPVCVDPTDNLFESKTAYIEEPVCTTLDACLTLISGTTTYTIVVLDSSVFTFSVVIKLVTGDPVIDAYIWRVVSIVDPTHVQIECTGAMTTDEPCIPVGTPVCEASCCETLSYVVSTPVCNEDWSSAQKVDLDLAWDADQTGITLNEGDPEYATATKSITITNDTCNPMQVLLTVDFVLELSFNVNEESWIRHILTPYVGYSTAILPAVPAAPAQTGLRTLYEDKTFGIGPSKCNAYVAYHHMQYHHTELVTVAAGRAMRYDAHIGYTYSSYRAGSESCCACGSLNADGNGLCTITNANTYIHALGVAVQAA